MKKILYGGDYNPDQWLDRPDILKEDIRLMKKAGVNEVTMGMFSWAQLEPEEGIYQFDWLKDTIDRLWENGICVILATPSGARPRWLAEKYPEVLRTFQDGRKAQFGGRHNHCLTSPVYRRKVAEIDKRLAQAFGSHPAVRYWHLSNELGGECFCEKCQEEFRTFLRAKYGTIDALNHEWWTSFWSHTYRSFDEISAPSSIGENETNGLILDWKRFVTAQTASFMRCEVSALREGGAAQPVTTNMMYDYDGLDYDVLSKEEDIVSWDSYPEWGKDGLDYQASLDHGMCHDYMRSLKDKPYLLMESCPSATNWQPVSRLKRPGLLTAASAEAVGHGSDSVLFFQIRQSRGASEKFHGALIDHTGRDDTRVFKEASVIGVMLERLSEVTGSRTDAKVGLIYDTQNRWAIASSQGPRNSGAGYARLVQKFYRALKIRGVDVDVISQDHSYDNYRLLIAPMLYSIRGGSEKRLRSFTEGGGTLLMTYLSGVVNENDLCYLGDTPHGLTDVLGIRTKEIDGLWDGESNHIVGIMPGNHERTSYSCDTLCELAASLDSNVHMVYGDDFYKYKPVLTSHAFGKGTAWYLAADAEQDFINDLTETLLDQAGVSPVMDTVPPDVSVQSREDDKKRYIFAENYGTEVRQIAVPAGAKLLWGDKKGRLLPYSVLIYSVEK